MTDEQMDARLRAAGERWRTANTAVAEPTEPGDVEITTSAQEHSHRRNRWAIVSAAAVVGALVLGGILFGRSSDDNGNSASEITKLTGVTWTDPSSNGAVVFLNRTARITGSCGTATHPLTINGDRLSIGTKTLGLANGCAAYGTDRVRADQLAMVRFLQFVHGPATWSIAADRLTLTKAGVGTITLTTDGAPAPQLVGSQWRLAEYAHYYKGRTALKNQVTGQTIDLHIATDGHFVASDQCDVIIGTASVGLDKVRFAWQPTCIDPGFSPISIAVDAVLSGTVTYTVTGDQLVLSAPRGKLIYRAVPTPSTDPNAELLGSWRLETITHGSPEHVIGTTTLTFYRNGVFSVARGCPGFRGAVSVSDQRLTISRVAAAAGPACPGNYTQLQEQQDSIVDGVLNSGTVDWALTGNQLAVVRNGAQLTFTRASSGVATELLGRWQLHTFGVGGPSAAATDTWITFGRNGNVQIDHRCGETRGTATSTDDRITFSALQMIGHSCPPAPNAAIAAQQQHEDQTVDPILAGTVTWSLNGDQLTLSKYDARLVFINPRIELVGSWRLESVSSGSISGRAHGPHLLTLDVSDKGKFFVGWACLPYQGNVEFGDQSATFTTTVIAPGPVCAPPQFPAAKQRVDGVVASVLDGAVTWLVSGNTLTVTKSGIGEATFVRAN